ncbi:MAG: hypothetical protein FIB04_13240 [Gammaproteobacteria bacterium]|nr:hypothetical protein [Gammaproteobacteria bacterium]
MRLVFTKGPGKSDRLQVFRPGRPAETVDCPKQRIIPHDMVHYAVEHTLTLRGFLNRVKAGEPAGFRMGADTQSDSVERLVEVFQGDAWSGGTTPPARMLELYAVTCEARACPALSIGEADVEAVRSAIASLDARWSAVAVGGALELDL